MWCHLQALPHHAGLLGAAQSAELDHVVAEHALAAVRALARLALLASAGTHQTNIVTLQSNSRSLFITHRGKGSSVFPLPIAVGILILISSHQIGLTIPIGILTGIILILICKRSHYTHRLSFINRLETTAVK